MGRRLILLLALVAVTAPAATLASTGPRGWDFSWHDTPTGTTASLRGLSAVSTHTAWASGATATGPTILRTTDRGATWQDVTPAGSPATLQFRDIEAFGPNKAVAMSAGTGTDSRIYRTTNGGATWTLTFQNEDPNAFYDCMTFFDHRRGIALSDPPDGMKFRILRTSDGGQTWSVDNTDGMPPALTGEFAFAASGQCITSWGSHHAWFGTGGADEARVFRSTDRGRTWRVSSTPMLNGPTAGVFALAFLTPWLGIATGGDFLLPDASPDSFARTLTGGRTWHLLTGAPDHYRSGAHWVNFHTVIAVGPSGSDVSTNWGQTWTRFDDGSLHTIDCAHPHACWASGANGRAAYLER
jgi:photosystem II stability/assembly factor-like uncharacterized protein